MGGDHGPVSGAGVSDFQIGNPVAIAGLLALAPALHLPVDLETHFEFFWAQ